MRLYVLLLALAFAPSLFADEPVLDLKKIEASLTESPEDPALHYQKCQALFANGKEQEAIEHAGIAIAKFKLAKNDLARLMLGSFKTPRYRIDVIYNMGPKERSDNRDGIVRPYSFRVLTLGEEPKTVKTIDFELGYSDGKVFTAAIGEMTSRGHANYGIVDPKSDFPSIKKKVLELLSK